MRSIKINIKILYLFYERKNIFYTSAIRNHFYLIALLFILAYTPTFTQLPDYNFTNYSLEELPGQYKGRMMQDEQGYIYIPTTDGLYRYDGVELKHYYHKQNDPTSLSLNAVTCVFPDIDGKVWVGTFDGGLNHLDPISGKCTIYRNDVNDPRSISGDRVNAIFRDSNGILWIGVTSLDYGLNVFNEKENNFTRIGLGETHLSKELKGHNNSINFINESQTGELMVTTWDGLWIRDKNTGAFSVYRCDTAVARIRNNLMGVTCEFPKGTLWICTWGGGLKKFDLLSKTFETNIWDKKNINTGTNNIAFSVLPKNDSILWIAAVDKGFGIYNISNKNFQFYDYAKFDLPSKNSGAFNIFQEKSKDANKLNGNIWITFDGSRCSKLNLNLQQLPYLPLPLKVYADRPEPSINTILKIPGTQQLIMGINWSDGLYLFDAKNNKTNKIVTNNGLVTHSGNVYLGNSGKIWVVNGNLNELVPRVNKLKIFEPFLKQNISGLYEMAEDKNNNLWFATDNGVLFYDTKKNVTRKYNAEQLNLRSGTQTHGIICDRNGNIWIGSDESGVYIFKPDSDKFINIKSSPTNNQLPFNTITDFAMDNSGRIWICGIGGVAICEGEPENLSIRSLSFESGLVDNHVAEIAFDGKENMWINGSHGVASINTNTFIVRNIDNKIFGDLIIQSLNIQRDGEIILGAAKGIIRFYPKDIPFENTPPSIVINAFKIFDKEYPIYSYDKTINLKYDQNYFSFDFAAITFTDAQKCQYKYKLEGFDKDWISSGNRRYVSYTNIPGGKYIFKVKGANADGIWNEKGISIPLFISTPWWKMWWFYLLVTIILVTVVYGIYRYRISQILKLERLRTSIASDLHDDIGSTLSSIKLMSDLTQNSIPKENEEAKNLLDKIGNSSKKMSENMQDIVWAINPKNESAENLLNRMQEFAVDILEAKEINLHFNFSEQFISKKLSLDFRRNVFLIFKETINNSAKYAKANNVWVDIKYVDGKFILEIRDDGVGFDLTAIKLGNGLINMEKRAKQLKGEYSIHSEPGKGTITKTILSIT